MQLGIDSLAAYLDTHYHDARLGLLCHAASVTSTGQHAVDVLGTDPKRWRLTTLFGPEHGIASRAEDMERVATTQDPKGHTIYSLYGNSPDSLRPTAIMLANIDCLVIDLQDIGTRYYTYIYTMAFAMSACAERNIPVIVCDRPNPIGGVATEGGRGDQRFASFVGWYPLPVRHGMTIGEVARHFNREHGIGATITILPMHGWQRAWHWEDTGLPWINPSPNMRSVAAALLYPGKCLLEATNISEGRGTATPFELCGAPWIDGVQLAKKLEALCLPGIAVAPVTFTPTSRKFSGQLCGGIRCTVTDRSTFAPYQFGLALLWALHALDPARFGWRTPQGNPPHTGLDAGPYEFNTVHPAIDLLTRGNQVRQAIDRGRGWDDIAHLARFAQ